MRCYAGSQFCWLNMHRRKNLCDQLMKLLHRWRFVTLLQKNGRFGSTNRLRHTWAWFVYKVDSIERKENVSFKMQFASCNNTVVEQFEFSDDKWALVKKELNQHNDKNCTMALKIGSSFFPNWFDGIALTGLDGIFCGSHWMCFVATLEGCALYARFNCESKLFRSIEKIFECILILWANWERSHWKFSDYGRFVWHAVSALFCAFSLAGIIIKLYQTLIYKPHMWRIPRSNIPFAICMLKSQTHSTIRFHFNNIMTLKAFCSFATEILNPHWSFVCA